MIYAVIIIIHIPHANLYTTEHLIWVVSRRAALFKRPFYYLVLENNDRLLKNSMEHCCKRYRMLVGHQGGPSRFYNIWNVDLFVAKHSQKISKIKNGKMYRFFILSRNILNSVEKRYHNAPTMTIQYVWTYRQTRPKYKFYVNFTKTRTKRQSTLFYRTR